MEIVKETGAYELRCTVSSCSAVDRPFHWHDNIELSYIIEKKCRFLVDGELIVADEGDIIAITEHTPHKFIVDADDTVIRTIQFPLKILLNEYSSVKSLKTHITANDIEKTPGLKSSLDSLFSVMDKEKSRDTIENNLLLKSLFTTVYLLLVRYFPQDEKKSNTAKSRNDFHIITEYINKNYKEDINVKKIASALFITQRRTSEIFRKYSGMTVNEYIHTLRIENVNRLLEEGSGITEASLESGFGCVRTFNNIYKEYMGITPSEYIGRR